MSLKTILVPIAEAESARPGLALALELAARLGARVTALYPTPDPAQTLPVFSEGAAVGVVDELISQIEHETRQRLEAAERALAEAAARHGVGVVERFEGPGAAARFLSPVGIAEQLIAAHGRVHDLIVMACPARNEPALSPALQAALMETGRAVLIAPPAPPASFARRVAVAWNGGLESARALGAALDLIGGAERVVVLAVEEEGRPGPSAEEAAGYLAAHGFAAAVKQRPAAGMAVAEALLLEADAEGADLLVMGAYSHSRLREVILGGVTRDILANLDFPVLMMH